MEETQVIEPKEVEEVKQPAEVDEPQADAGTGGDGTEETKKAPKLVNLDNLTSEDIKALVLENEMTKKWLEKEKDSHFSKSLATWKQNNLEKEVEREILKRYPAETPEQIKIRELEQRFVALEKEKEQKEITAKALKVLSEKALPVEMMDFVMGQDETSTLANVDKFEQLFNSAVAKAVDSKFKEHGRKPEQGHKVNGYQQHQKRGDVKSMLKAKMDI